VKNVQNVSKEIRVKRTLFPDCCFFCNSDRRENVRNVSTKNLDRKIKECAQIQNDVVLAKIGTGDLIALEAKYHRSCLGLYIRKPSAENQSIPCPVNHHESTAFAELVSHIEESLDLNPEKCINWTSYLNYTSIDLFSWALRIRIPT
jgi:hypothetical protein